MEKHYELYYSPSLKFTACFIYIQLLYFRLIEQAGITQRRSCAEIFLEEWGTSGRIRPDLAYLVQLLGKAQLFRAADYVTDLLKGMTQ